MTLRLIKAGADLNARDSAQCRPLDLASNIKPLTVFHALLAKGADPSPVPVIPTEASTRDGRSVHYLQSAVIRNRPDVLRAAAAAGINLKKLRCLGTQSFPLLIECAHRHSVECARFLLERGVDENEVSEVVFDRNITTARGPVAASYTAMDLCRDKPRVHRTSSSSWWEVFL